MPHIGREKRNWKRVVSFELEGSGLTFGLPARWLFGPCTDVRMSAIGHLL